MKTSNRTSSPAAHMKLLEASQHTSSKLPPPAHTGAGKLGSRPQSTDPLQGLGVVNLSRPNSRSPIPSISPFAAGSSPYPHMSPSSSLNLIPDLPPLPFNISNIPVLQSAGLVCHPNISAEGQSLPFPFGFSFDNGIGAQLDQSFMPSNGSQFGLDHRIHGDLQQQQFLHRLPVPSRTLLDQNPQQNNRQQVAFVKDNFNNLPLLGNYVDYSDVANSHNNLSNINSSLSLPYPRVNTGGKGVPSFVAHSHMPPRLPPPLSGLGSTVNRNGFSLQHLLPTFVEERTTVPSIRDKIISESNLDTTRFAGSSYRFDESRSVVSNRSLPMEKLPDAQQKTSLNHNNNNYANHTQSSAQQYQFAVPHHNTQGVNNNNFVPISSSSTSFDFDSVSFQYPSPPQQQTSNLGKTSSVDFEPNKVAVTSSATLSLSVADNANASSAKPAQRHPPIPKKRIFLPSPEPANDAVASGTSVNTSVETATEKINSIQNMAQRVPNVTSEQQATRTEEKLVPVSNAFNMRVVNLDNFIASSSRRTTGRSHAQSIAVLRAKAGAITNAAKSLDLLRQLLQRYINEEIDAVIKRYLEDYFLPGIENIKANQGSVDDGTVETICCQMLEEAKKMYDSSPRETVPTTPSDVGDCAAKKLSENQFVRANKLSLFHIRKRKSLSDVDLAKKKKKAKVSQPSSVPTLSGRNTPLKSAKGDNSAKESPHREWNPSRLTESTEFVIGSRANRALGLGQTRGRLYTKHPEIFKYLGDQEDKQWLCERHYMPATGGKSYIVIVDDIRRLAASPEYCDCPDLELDALVGFTVPEWMLVKMRALMQASTASPHHLPPPPLSDKDQTPVSNSTDSDLAAAKDALDSDSGLMPNLLPDTSPPSPALTIEAGDSPPLVNNCEDDDLGLPTMSPLPLLPSIGFGSDSNDSASLMRSDLSSLDFPALPVRFAIN